MNTFTVTRDGVVRFSGTETDCFGYLLKCQPMSVYWATKYEGWNISRI